MTNDPNNLIQEKLTDRSDERDPEYVKLLNAYIDNPFLDLTKARIAEYTASKEKTESASSEL